MAPKVLVLGMPRTGTQSMVEALKVLGFDKTYHMTTVGPNNHHDAWASAVKNKFSGTSTASKPFLDRLLQDYDAVADFPASIFYRELLDAYPDAHIILSIRDEDKWFASMCRTLHAAFVTTTKEPSRLARLFHQHLWENDFVANGREAYRTHNESVLCAAKEMNRSVLLFDPSYGWAPLCKALDKSVPMIPYPHKDAWRGYKEMVDEVEAGRLIESALDVSRQGLMMDKDMSTDQIQKRAVEGIRSAYIYTQ